MSKVWRISGIRTKQDKLGKRVGRHEKTAIRTVFVKVDFRQDFKLSLSASTFFVRKKRKKEKTYLSHKRRSLFLAFDIIVFHPNVRLFNIY